jgi:glycosyltransferase involved in cell wall biosynthesis
VLCGRPVVVTDVVPSGDELTKAAVIVPSDDVSALFNALRQLIIDKASYLSKQGHGDMYGQVFFDPQRGLQAALRRGLLL